MQRLHGSGPGSAGAERWGTVCSLIATAKLNDVEPYAAPSPLLCVFVLDQQRIDDPTQLSAASKDSTGPLALSCNHPETFFQIRTETFGPFPERVFQCAVDGDRDQRITDPHRHLQFGYKTMQAPDGPVALELLANSPKVDLLFSDVVLPGGTSGPEIYQRIKEQRPDLRCLLMSGYAETVEETLSNGVDLLSKPFDIAELAQKLRSTLGA